MRSSCSKPACVHLTGYAWLKDRGLWFVLILIAAAVRLIGLGRASYTIDESELIKIALSHPTIGELFRTEWERFAFLHRLPLPMVLLRLFTQGTSFRGAVPPEWITRLPMALFGILTVAMMGWWGVIFRDRRMGMWATFLCAISFFAVFYSREAYDYSFLILMVSATLQAGAWFCHKVLSEEHFPFKAAVLYVVSASILLQSHLAALLFLSPLTAMLVLVIARGKGLRVLLGGNNPARWLATLGLPYLLFSPFLLKLFGGFVVTESDVARRFSVDVFPALWGRMGWGQGVVPLTLFVLFWGLGCLAALCERDPVMRGVGIVCVFTMVAYFVLQSWMLRVSRFEIRYYSPLFPMLILMVARGLVHAEDMIHAKSRWAAQGLRMAVGIGLAVWSTPSLWWILQLECRGFANFKGIARWVNENIPERGLYAFLNVYDLRGVPQTYPTPDRFGTCVTYWSSKEEHIRAQPVERVKDFFTQFPTAYFVEIAPRDLLAAHVAEDFIPRGDLFMRQVWLSDPAFDKLVQWKTLPLGDTQHNATNEHKILISYNLPEDLSQWAYRGGRVTYHYYGSEWVYQRDQERRDWMMIQVQGTLWLGNASRTPQKAQLSFWAASIPERSRITVSAGEQFLLENKEIPPYPTRVIIRDMLLPPGQQAVFFKISGAASHPRSYVGLHHVEVELL